MIFVRYYPSDALGTVRPPRDRMKSQLEPELPTIAFQGTSAPDARVPAMPSATSAIISNAAAGGRSLCTSPARFSISSSRSFFQRCLPDDPHEEEIRRFIHIREPLRDLKHRKRNESTNGDLHDIQHSSSSQTASSGKRTTAKRLQLLTSGERHPPSYVYRYRIG